ncbi:phage major capsid protein, P2 family [Microbulbifer variabilis]|uniref:Phage major capsid protein, P2 family n=1 Tax=Microbulbifer variabilis TaxID=266805 RepID=A0ABY4V8P5_9GAMM|nr:phage major capsid protein, P2 family [Microbulbifer variabilis]USD19776.1 phage major capsid protein, P2 family [Microbulbifer variabilis]
MRNDTRLKFASLASGMAKTYGVEMVDKTFSASPSVEQKLQDKIVESSSFLQRINVIGVDELKGEKIFGSATGLVGKRTNTTNNDRQTSDPLGLDPFGYECVKTEYDVHILYQTLDAWAKFKNFNGKFMDYVRKAIAHARIKQGFYGTHRAAETNPSTSPNGEDVNKGWFQKLREYNAGAQMLTEGGTVGQIRLGPGGDYENLDAMVHDVLQLVAEPHRDGEDLVALIGRDLLAQDKAQLYTAQGQNPTEKERVENSAVTRTYGGLLSHPVPFFPVRGLMITSWDNLSLYYQSGAVRQKIEDNAKRDRVEHYNTMNEDYVVETLDKAAGIEFANVKLPDGNGGWQ